MKPVIFALLLSVLLLPRGAAAQDDTAWVQIEAHPSLRVAEQRARDYAAQLADVNGFSLGGSWYGIVLGPYARSDANRVLRFYRQEGQIPRDSFLTFDQALGQQFWPIGADVLNRGTVRETPLPDPASTEQANADIAVQISDETASEARRSEQLLSADARKQLQLALQAEGYYNSTIDGAFGRGTRNSMAAWQRANGFDPTGILTTAQRQQIMDLYNAPLVSVGMRRMRDDQAGIELESPAEVVRFSRYEPPFAHYEASTDLGARVLLISQPGTRATLRGLYDVMQTLEIVPLDGPREFRGTGFTLEGRGQGIVSYTQAQLTDGEIKGFTLIWPQDDEARRKRVLERMIASFTPIDGVLDPATGADSEQNVDLISGLEIRKPRLTRSGFFIDGKGTVLTTSDVTETCARITLDEELKAEVVASDGALGIAALRPAQPLAPMAVARFRELSPRLNANVTVAGYSYGGLLGAPTLTFGTVSDLRGLKGEDSLNRLALAALPGDAGGPVFDGDGGVLGMLLAPQDQSRQLPDGVEIAANADAIRAFLREAGLGGETDSAAAALTPDALSRIASGMTVLVSCWE